jgi:hypothetical protein
VWSITLLSYLWYKHSGPRNPAVSITRPPECNLHSGMSGNNDVEHIYTYTVNVYIFSKYQIRYAMFTTRSTSHVHHTLNKPCPPHAQQAILIKGIAVPVLFFLFSFLDQGRWWHCIWKCTAWMCVYYFTILFFFAMRTCL